MKKYLLALLFFLPAVAYAEEAPVEIGDCKSTPEAAIVELPSPIDQWGKIVCKTNGYVITHGEGYYWMYYGSNTEVEIPSQMVRENPKPVGNKSYFTDVSVTLLENEDAQAALDIFERDFDKSEKPPNVYRMTAKSVSGRQLAIDFFQYNKHHWGMWCTNECDPNARFMILDLN